MEKYQRMRELAGEQAGAGARGPRIGPAADTFPENLTHDVTRPAQTAPGLHWSTRYLGRPFHPLTHDCADLVVDVLRTEFGRTLTLPGRAATVRGRDAQITDLAYRFGRPVAAPAEGDVALMRAAGRRYGVGHHVGVWCCPDGRSSFVLHCAARIGTCLHPVGALADRGYELQMVYRCL